MNTKFTHPNIAIAKKQAQIIRYSLKEYPKYALPKSNEMLNYWTQCFDFSNWQHFIRQINGHSSDVVSTEIVNNDNFILISSKLHNLIPAYDIEHIKWALTTSHIANHNIDSNLLKQLIIRTPPRPISPQLAELHQNGFIDFYERNSIKIKNERFVSCVTTELGKYSAAIKHEENIGHNLSELDLVQFGLHEKLCKLERISREFSIS